MDIRSFEESKGDDSEDADFYDGTVPLFKIPQKSYMRNTHRMQSVLEPFELFESSCSYNYGNPVDWTVETVKGSNFSNGKSVFVSDFYPQHEVLEPKNRFGLLSIIWGGN